MSPARTNNQKSGFTLIEVVVTLGIMGLSSLLIVPAFPLLRDRQQQLVAVREFKSLMRQAQQMSLNAQSSPECLQHIGIAEADVFNKESRVCAQTGLAVKDSEYYLFIDASNDKQFSGAVSDIVVARGVLGGEVAVIGSDWRTFLFVPAPPLTTLYVDGAPLSPRMPATVALRQGSHVVTLQIYSSGVVERL